MIAENRVKLIPMESERREVRALPCVLPFKKEGRDSPAFVDKV